MAVESTTTIRNQFYLENRNYLSPVGFIFVLNKLPAVTFLCQRVNLPGISTGTAVQPTRFNRVPQPSDELIYDQLQIEFLIDENLKNWMQIHNWLRGITGSIRDEEFIYNRGLIKSPHQPKSSDINSLDPELQEKTEASLIILSSNYQPVCTIAFHDIFPTSISPLPFDTTVNDVRHLSARASFAYSYYDIQIEKAAEATDATMNSVLYTSKGDVIS
jgi:hypothetical protein